MYTYIGKTGNWAKSLRNKSKTENLRVFDWKRRTITRQLCEQFRAIEFPKGKNYECTKRSSKKHKRTEEIKTVKCESVKTCTPLRLFTSTSQQQKSGFDMTGREGNPKPRVLDHRRERNKWEVKKAADARKKHAKGNANAWVFFKRIEEKKKKSVSPGYATSRASN